MVIEQSFRDVKKLALQLLNDGVLLIGQGAVLQFATKQNVQVGQSAVVLQAVDGVGRFALFFKGSNSRISFAIILTFLASGVALIKTAFADLHEHGLRQIVPGAFLSHAAGHDGKDDLLQLLVRDPWVVKLDRVGYSANHCFHAFSPLNNKYDRTRQMFCHQLAHGICCQACFLKNPVLLPWIEAD
jgi:hypothetical protein